MDRSMIVGVVVGVAVATAGGTIAGYNLLRKGPTEAQVLSVQEVTQTVSTPREECRDVAVTRQRPVQDEKRIAGTAIGAVVGGVVGSKIGGGSGKTLATIAGAAAGGYAGNQVQKNLQQRDTYTETQRECDTVTDSHEELVGYDVEYRLGEQVATVRMDHHPGETLPVKDGKVVTDAPAVGPTAGN